MPKKPEKSRLVSMKRGTGGETHQQGGGLTTNFGLPISDNQNSLKAGDRGPSLLEDFRSPGENLSFRS